MRRSIVYVRTCDCNVLFLHFYIMLTLLCCLSSLCPPLVLRVTAMIEHARVANTLSQLMTAVTCMDSL